MGEEGATDGGGEEGGWLRMSVQPDEAEVPACAYSLIRLNSHFVSIGHRLHLWGCDKEVNFMRAGCQRSWFRS